MVYEMDNEKEYYEPIDDGVELETIVGIGAANRLLSYKPKKSGFLSKIKLFCSELFIYIKRFIFLRKRLKTGKLRIIPVDYVIESDLKSMSRKKMTCVRTKSGAVVVTPMSAREIRKNYKGCSVVEPMIK